MIDALVKKFASPVPRYTSYPTAPHFHTGVDEAAYATWMDGLAQDAGLSLYLHLPFCDRLCWFCGCHTKQVNRYAPIARYLLALHVEIERRGRQSGGRPVRAVHWGGGSPSLLTPEDILATTGWLADAFHFADGVEFSVELDPNDMDGPKFDAWAKAGMTRASVGVQDFDPVVQRAINREQSFQQTSSVVTALRERGIASVNIDMLYGLPHQTRRGIEDTARQVVSLRPDRIALFGYAHVPWIKKHQTMIPDSALPGATERFVQSELAARILLEAGYLAVGLDHFALPEDTLVLAKAAGTLHRNFQGYTVDGCEALIGLGASAIGRMPQGYVQNVVSTADYQRRSLEGGGTIAKGLSFTEEDRVRGYAIERLMCDFALDFADLRARFGGAAEPVIAEATALALEDIDGLVAMLPGILRVTEVGRPFVRTVASRFDAYLPQDTARYSRAV